MAIAWVTGAEADRPIRAGARVNTAAAASARVSTQPTSLNTGTLSPARGPCPPPGRAVVTGPTRTPHGVHRQETRVTTDAPSARMVDREYRAGRRGARGGWAVAPAHRR